MTKICGIVSVDDAFEVLRPLKSAYEASWQPSYVRKEIWRNGCAGLGHMSVGAVNLDPQPLLRDDGDEAIVYCGKIFDYQKLKAKLVRNNAVFRLRDNDAELLGELLRQAGPSGFEAINGIYSLAVWNRRQRRLTLVNDRYGLRSMYYYHDVVHGTFVFSSDVRGVIESGIVPKRIDWPACSTFLYHGHHLGDNTFFRDVHLVPPASVLIFENNQVRIEPYWSLNSIAMDDQIDYPTVLEESRRRFSQAIQRQDVPVAGKKVVLLSGGLDSRRIAAERRRQGMELETYTTGWDTTSPDAAVARKVADALGVKNTLVCFPQRRLMTQYWPRGNSLVDYETVMHQWLVPLAELLPQEAKVNYDGLAGDIPFNGMRRDSEFVDLARFQQTLTEDARTVAERIVGPEFDLSALSVRLRRHLLREHVVAATEKELKKYDHAQNRLPYFYLMNRTRRATALSPTKVLALSVESFFPFLDKDLFSFIMSVPPALKMTHQLREDMCDAYPEIRKASVAAYTRTTRGRKVRAHHPRTRIQRRQYFLWNVRHRYFGMNWAFNNVQAGPRVLGDLVALHAPKAR